MSTATTAKIRVAILGASGYGGAELVRTLLAHPKVEIVALGGESAVGQKLSELYPALRGTGLVFEKLDADVLKGRVEVVFLGLPHTQSMNYTPAFLKAGIKVIDLSGDFRLKDVAAYEQYYKTAHVAKDLIPGAVYGMPELHKAEIQKASLVANPGCYTTTSILALAPLMKAKLIRPGSIVIDAKSGVSGAGRKLTNSSMFVDAYDNFSIYKAGGVHQHIPEIEQELALLAGEKMAVTFTPHLLPLSRGILATCYAEPLKPVTEAELQTLYQGFYKGQPFVRVYVDGELPTLRSVRGTNYCDLGLKVDLRTGRIIVVSCTDNLGKGAAYQAVHNLNLMCGFEETEGLEFSALAV